MKKHECIVGNVVSTCLGWAQDVPIAYWRTHGLEGFDGIWYTLNNPLSPWTVKVAKHTWGKQTFCFFTKGWAGFCTANELTFGDTLIFTKVGLVEFEVRKV